RAPGPVADDTDVKHRVCALGSDGGMVPDLDSVRSVAGKYGAGRLEQDLEVEPERPGFRVLEVETYHVVEAQPAAPVHLPEAGDPRDRKSTRLNSSHQIISYAVFCLKKKTQR